MILISLKNDHNSIVISQLKNFIKIWFFNCEKLHISN